VFVRQEQKEKSIDVRQRGEVKLVGHSPRRSLQSNCVIRGEIMKGSNRGGENDFE